MVVLESFEHVRENVLINSLCGRYVVVALGNDLWFDQWYQAGL